MEHRNSSRKEAMEKGLWPPDASKYMVTMNTEFWLPVSFSPEWTDRNIGPFFEMRIYTYPPEDMPDILHTWQAAMPAREQLSPLVGCWYKESGGNDNFIHMWAYESFEERLRIREHAKTTGIWPPKSSARLLKQNSKILLPASFSPNIYITAVVSESYFFSTFSAFNGTLSFIIRFLGIPILVICRTFSL